MILSRINNHIVIPISLKSIDFLGNLLFQIDIQKEIKSFMQKDTIQNVFYPQCLDN